MYRKKKRRKSDADKEEIVGEAITIVIELLKVAGGAHTGWSVPHPKCTQ